MWKLDDKNRIILGIRESETRQELLKICKLSLHACVDVCRAAESAISHRSVLDDVCVTVYVVNHGRLFKRECRSCGRCHAPKKEMCPAYGKTCNNCGAKDNFERKCMKGRNTNQLSRNQHQRCVYNIRDNNGPDEDDDSGDTWVHSLTPRKRHRCRSQYAASQIRQRCCPIQWHSHNVEQNDDKTAGEVSNVAEQPQNGDIKWC